MLENTLLNSVNAFGVNPVTFPVLEYCCPNNSLPAGLAAPCVEGTEFINGINGALVGVGVVEFVAVLIFRRAAILPLFPDKGLIVEDIFTGCLLLREMQKLVILETAVNI